MKIVFTAFGDMLKSKAQEYPDDTPMDIMLRLDLQLFTEWTDSGELKASNRSPIFKIGRFVFTGRSVDTGEAWGDKMAKVYSLMDLS